MKIGVIADIHSNHTAFKAGIDYLVDAGCSQFLLLGDFVSDTAAPIETMQELYALTDRYPCHILRGNREEYMLSQRAIRSGKADGPIWKRGSASGNLLYTYERLSKDDLNFFESLPITFRFEYEDYPAITCCHGSPVRSNELLQLDSPRTVQVLRGLDTDMLIAAHTHYPGVVNINGRTYANTGSCGISIGDPGYAHMLIIEGDTDPVSGARTWNPISVRIPYDNRAVVKEMFTSGLFDMAPWFICNNIHILLTGVDLTVELVEAARSLAQADGISVPWPDVPEIYFEKAAAIAGIPDYSNYKEL